MIWKRLAIGLLQGLALYLVFCHNEAIRPNDDRTVFIQYLLVAVVPIILVVGLNNLRVKTLLVWVCAVTILLMVFGGHLLRVYHYVLANSAEDPTIKYDDDPLAAIVTSFLIGIFVFIAHTLVAAGDSERKWIASYSGYFDAAWKHTVQVFLAIVFLGVFWGLLLLGGGLFSVIGIETFHAVIRSKWFIFPATMLTIATALHVTDVRPGIIRGIRTLKLTLFSWLLPIAVFIATLFLIRLPVSGTDRLWHTHHGALLLFGMVLPLIYFLNATYQDGSIETPRPKILRYSGRWAAILLLPLTALILYALISRISEYGLSKERVYACALALLVTVYSAGYFLTALDRRTWLKRLECVNVFAALVALGIIFLLLTPFADPARLTVASQLHRLSRGDITLTQLDTRALHRSGIYGQNALKQLGITDWNRKADETRTENRQDLRANIAVYPEGRTLPDSFVNQDWLQEYFGSSEVYASPCLGPRVVKCNAYFVHWRTNGQESLALDDGTTLAIFEQQPDGKWQKVANSWLREIFLKDNNLQTVPKRDYQPTTPLWNDVEVNGKRIHLNSIVKE